MKHLKIFLANIGFRRPRYPQVSPPIGLLYLAAYLRTKFDADFRIVNQLLDDCSDDSLIRQAVDFQADIIGLRALTSTAYSLEYITQSIRQKIPDALIVLGGPHVSASNAEALEGTAANAAVPGEGERAMEEIIHAYFDGGGLTGIPGVFWRNKENEIISNPGMPLYIKDLDSLPFPAYDLIRLPPYWRHQSFAAIPRRRYISLFTSRGCPYSCIYCHRIFGNRFRQHSAERVVEEIRYFQKQYGVNDIEFVDDIFNIDSKRLFRFCDLIHQYDLKIKIVFPNGVRTDILTEDSIDALVDAGLYFSCFALESGSPRIQELIGKNLNIPKFLRNVELATARRVHANGFAMLGFPTETEDEMQQTIDVLCQSRLHTLSCFTAVPYPNTDLYHMARQIRPEQLAKMRYNNKGFVNSTINLADVPDEVLFHYQRKANRKFYLNPNRIWRLLRDHPQPHLLPLYIPHFLQRIVKASFLGA